MNESYRLLSHLRAKIDILINNVKKKNNFSNISFINSRGLHVPRNMRRRRTLKTGDAELNS